MKPRWYVITGSPSSGKTTIINSLSKLGYHTVPEAARTFIDGEMIKGKKLEEIRIDEIEFQRKVLEIKLRIEKELPKNKIVFFDRAVPDSIAYLSLYGSNIEELLRYCKEKVYDKVFLLEKLPFQRDYARNEDEETAEKLHILLRKAYSDLGYEIIDVPVMPVEDRLRMILSKID